MNEFGFAFTEDQWVRLSERLSWRATRWVILVAAIYVLYCIFIAQDIFAYSVILVLLVAMVGSFAWNRRRYRKIYREQLSVRDKMICRVFPDLLEMESRTGTVRLTWIELVKWNVLGDTLFLYPSRAMAIPIPVDAMGAKNLELIKGRLADAGLPFAGKRRKQ